MKTYVLGVPTKNTDELNWLKPLTRYLLSIYGESHEYQQDIASFNKLRRDLKGVNGDTTGLKLYFKYYSQLELLDLRIPFSQIQSSKLQFVWYDAFQRTVSHKQTALPFEKANVLFNLASIITRFACQKYEDALSSSEGEAEGIKEVLQLFQQAAGIYEFISENFLHAPSNDLGQSTLLFFKRFLLAQAQEVFVLRVITGDLEQQKNSLIAKLCASAGEHYHECFKMIDSAVPESVSTSEFDLIDDVEQEDELEAIVDEPYDPNSKPSNKITIKLDGLWTALIQFKATYYKSLSYYFNGLQLEATNKFGDAIAYVTKSQDILNEIRSTTLKQISASNIEAVFDVLDNYKFNKDALAIKLAELTKDNDLIYHDPIPSLVTLPAVKALDSTKVIPMKEILLFNETTAHSYENFLKNVVPIDTHELLSLYSEEKSQFLRNELDMVDVSNEELSSVLEYLKMPKAVTGLKDIINDNEVDSNQLTSSTIDSSTVAKVSEISQNYNQDESNKAKIIDTRKKIYSALTAIESKSNSIVGSKYRDDIINVKKSLYEMTTSDDRLFKLINVENNELYSIIAKGPQSPQFKNLFEVPNSKLSAVQEEVSLLDIVDTPVKPKDDLQSQIKVVEDILYDLNVIKSNKGKLVDTLKQEIHNDDISDIIVLNSKVKTTTEIKNVIFPEELKKFEPYATELDKLIENQKKFIDNLQSQWAKLSSNPKIKEIQSSKAFKDTLFKDQIQRINTFYDNNWKAYSLGLKRGTEVYEKLLTFVQNLQSQIENDQGEDLSDRFRNISIAPSATGGSYHQSPSLQFPPPPQRQGSQNYFPQASGNHIPTQYSGNSAHNGSPYHGDPFPQPQLHRTLTSSTHSGYERPPPSLPPKQPQQYAPQQYHQPPQQFQQSYQQPPQQQQYQQPPQQQQYQQPPQQQYQQQYQQYQSAPQSAYGYQPQPPARPPQQPQSEGQFKAPGRTESNLIYDQPSTYNPDMYNFFSQK